MMNLNEILIKAYKFFSEIIGTSKGFISSLRILPTLFKGNEIETGQIYLYEKEGNFINQNENNIDLFQFKSFSLINDYIFKTIISNKLFSYSSGVYIPVDGSNSIPNDDRQKIVFKKSFNKILSIIFKPILTKSELFDDKVNLLINLEKKFNDSSMLNQFIEIVEKEIKNNDKEIKSFIYSLEVKNYLRYLKEDDNYSSLFFTPKEKVNGFVYTFFNSSQNFPIFVTNLVLNNHKKENIDLILHDINSFLSYRIEDFDYDIYELINKGKSILNNWMLSKNKSTHEDIEEFWNNNGLQNILCNRNKFGLDYPEKYEKLYLIYIGYAHLKGEEELIDRRLSELFSQDKKALTNDFKNISVSKNYDWLLENVILDKQKFISNEFINNITNIHNYQEYKDKIEQIYDDNVINWIEDKIAEFQKKFNLQLKSLDHNLVNWYWKISIYTLYSNKDNLNINSLNDFIFSLLTYVDISIANELKQVNFNSIPKEKLEEINDKLYIKSSYNIEISKKNIKDVYEKYTDKLDYIDNISLVDNSMLSIIDKFKFTYYEYVGDIIYNTIIHDLKLDCEIDYDNQFDPFNYNVQNIICNSINFNKFIQVNELKNVFQKQPSDSDYFEVFLYFIYKLEGYKKCRSIILDLIKENYDELLISNNKKEFIIEEEKFCSKDWELNNRLTYFQNKYYHLLRYEDLQNGNYKNDFSLYNLNLVFVNNITKLQRKIFSNFLKIESLENDCKFDDITINTNFNEKQMNISFTKKMNDYIERKIERYNNKFESDYFYSNLYNLYYFNFDEFFEFIKKTINSWNK